MKIVCALHACLANSFYFDINMLYSTAIENTNNIFYCSVKPTYVAFLTLTLIITNYCSGTFLALHGTFHGSSPIFDHTHTTKNYKSYHVFFTYKSQLLVPDRLHWRSQRFAFRRLPADFRRYRRCHDSYPRPSRYQRRALS